MKILLILIKIFVIAALLIISNQGLAMDSAENREKFIQDYSLWISNLIQKGMSTVSYVVKTEWLPRTTS